MYQLLLEKLSSNNLLDLIISHNFLYFLHFLQFYKKKYIKFLNQTVNSYQAFSFSPLDSPLYPSQIFSPGFFTTLVMLLKYLLMEFRVALIN